MANSRRRDREFRVCECLRCGYKWAPRAKRDSKRDPARCPGCGSSYWNKPYSARARMLAESIMARLARSKQQGGR